MLISNRRKRGPQLLPTRNELVREAIQISKELTGAVFVGAIAVYLHINTGRESRDLDSALASKITDEELQNKGYQIFSENGKDVRRSPRNYKVDIFVHDVSGIPIKTIIRRAVDKKGIKVASLEALVVAKHRSDRLSRPQDHQDLRDIAATKYTVIDLESTRNIRQG